MTKNEQHRFGCRSGFTILEMLLVTGIAVTLFTVTISLLIGVLQYQPRASQQQAAEQELQRLSVQLRSDLRRASSIRLLSKRELSLELATGEVVQFVLEAEECRREVDGKTGFYTVHPQGSWGLRDDIPGCWSVWLSWEPAGRRKSAPLPGWIVAQRRDDAIN